MSQNGDMFGWSFAARSLDSFDKLCRAMARHRYLRETDHRLHWTIDAALAPLDPAFARAAQLFKVTRNQDQQLDPRSRDPRLWRSVEMDEIRAALSHFWQPDKQARAAASLLSTLEQAELSLAEHAPFASHPDEPPHPELVLLDWVLLPVDELDSERHAGALSAMEDSGDEIDPSEPIYVEGPTLSSSELCAGAPDGQLIADPVFWASGPYSYIDYLFRGVRRAAKLTDAPLGYRDIDAL